jgi:hypothetical protein
MQFDDNSGDESFITILISKLYLTKKSSCGSQVLGKYSGSLTTAMYRQFKDVLV